MNEVETVADIPSRRSARAATRAQVDAAQVDADGSTESSSNVSADGSSTVSAEARSVVPAQTSAFAVNVLLLVVLGTAVSAWLLYFSSWFDVFGGLLALGGLFSWLAFVSRILPEQRVKDLQTWLDERFFSRRAAHAPLLIAIAGLAVLATFLGSIQVRSVGDSKDRLLWTSADALPTRLAPGDTVRALTWTTPWRPASRVVRISGYPPLAVRVAPWQRVTRDVPGFFHLVPVILLQPARGLMPQAHSGLTLVVSVGGAEYSQPFDGHTVWVGCDADVEVPAPTLDAWRTGDGEFVSSWSRPTSVTGSQVTLRAGEHVTAKLLNANGATYGEPLTITVRQPATADDFPQVEVLHEPRS